MQVLIVQYAGAFFGVISLPLDMWLKIFGVAASVIVVSEVVKLVRRATANALHKQPHPRI